MRVSGLFLYGVAELVFGVLVVPVLMAAGARCRFAVVSYVLAKFVSLVHCHCGQIWLAPAMQWGHKACARRKVRQHTI